MKADDAAKLTRYREFTDRYAELTAMMFNSPPPGPRLALDAALAKHGVVPVEIKRTLGGDEKNIVKATHTFYWKLAPKIANGSMKRKPTSRTSRRSTTSNSLPQRLARTWFAGSRNKLAALRRVIAVRASFAHRAPLVRLKQRHRRSDR